MGNSVSSSRDSSTVEVFMKEGGCKESWTAFQDCAEKKKESFDDTDCYSMLEKCMKARSEYYQPFFAAEKAAEELLRKDFLDLFIPSAAGRDLSECEGDANVAEDLEKFAAYVEGGACKQSFTACLDCLEEAEKNKEDEHTKCGQHLSTMMKCVNSHPDYYHPVFALANSAEENMWRELEKSL